MRLVLILLFVCTIGIAAEPGAIRHAPISLGDVTLKDGRVLKDAKAVTSTQRSIGIISEGKEYVIDRMLIPPEIGAKALPLPDTRTREQRDAQWVADIKAANRKKLNASAAKAEAESEARRVAARAQQAEIDRVTGSPDYRPTNPPKPETPEQIQERIRRDLRDDLRVVAVKRGNNSVVVTMRNHGTASQTFDWKGLVGRVADELGNEKRFEPMSSRPLGQVYTYAIEPGAEARFEIVFSAPMGGRARNPSEIAWVSERWVPVGFELAKK